MCPFYLLKFATAPTVWNFCVLLGEGGGCGGWKCFGVFLFFFILFLFCLFFFLMLFFFFFFGLSKYIVLTITTLILTKLLLHGICIYANFQARIIVHMIINAWYLFCVCDCLYLFDVILVRIHLISILIKQLNKQKRQYHKEKQSILNMLNLKCICGYVLQYSYK